METYQNVNDCPSRGWGVGVGAMCAQWAVSPGANQIHLARVLQIADKSDDVTATISPSYFPSPAVAGVVTSKRSEDEVGMILLSTATVMNQVFFHFTLLISVLV